MAAVRVLAAEHTKFTILTAAPADPAAPTAAELNAGIDVSCKVFADDFKWTASDSDTVGERALCERTASEGVGLANYDLGFTYWRYFDETTGAPDPTEDALHTAVKDAGTELYGYVRRTGKAYSDAWAAADEIALGGSFTVGSAPQFVADDGGFTKYRVQCLKGAMQDFIAVGA
jgi:hypothetical protein